MNRRLIALLLLAVVLVVSFVWWRSDRRRLASRLNEAIEQVSKEGPEDQLTTFGKMRRLVGLFAPGFVVLGGAYEGSISDAQQLAGVVASYRSTVSELRFVVRHRTLELDATRGTAQMLLTLDSISRGEGGPSHESYRFRIAWVRNDGEWWIQEVELLEVGSPGRLVP